MGAGVFHGRVRDGNGCINPAMATGPPGRILWMMDGMIRVLCVLRGLALCAVGWRTNPSGGVWVSSSIG